MTFLSFEIYSLKINFESMNLIKSLKVTYFWRNVSWWSIRMTGTFVSTKSKLPTKVENKKIYYPDTDTIVNKLE